MFEFEGFRFVELGDHADQFLGVRGDNHNGAVNFGLLQSAEHAFENAPLSEWK
jgi:hypothetical protein